MHIEICDISSLRLSWLLSLNIRISILHRINRKCLLNNIYNALYRWVSLTSQGTPSDFHSNKEHDPFLIKYRKSLSVSGTERGYLSPGDTQICLPRCWSERGWRGRNANNSYCFTEDLRHRAASHSPCMMWSSLVPTSIQHLLAHECFFQTTSGHLQQQCSVSPWLIAPSKHWVLVNGDDGSEQAVQSRKVIKSSRHSSTTAGASTGSSPLPHVQLVHVPADGSWELPHTLVFGDNFSFEEAGPLRHNFVFLLTHLSLWGNFLILRKICFLLKKVRRHWSATLMWPLQFRKVKQKSIGFWSIIPPCPHTPQEFPWTPATQSLYPGFSGQGMFSGEFKNSQLSI